MPWIKNLCDALFSSSADPSVMRLRDFFSYVFGSHRHDEVLLTFLLRESQQPVKHLAVAMGGFLHRTAQQKKLTPLETDNAHLDLESLERDLMHVTRCVQVLFEGKYIFTTAGGRLGHSPKQVSPGDRICIAPGGMFLHVFSAAPSRYVTCASVHGLMEDNLSDFVQESGRGWEEIAIH
jgi:hypothetical protein